ncbi:hypothetical protein F5B21DRAFT_14107 [Xylaria acuta]|nr:hypothetical protein F5B21DRAFT_14107 [Xylaria acuta]
MELHSVLSKEASRIPRKSERPYISSLKSCSMETRRRPLRTYGKRTSSESTEPTPKRRCIAGSSMASSPEERARITSSEPEHNTASSISNSPPLPSIKKGTITAYFGRIMPQAPAVTLSPYLSSDLSSGSNEPTITPPSSSPVIATRKRRARRLKTRVVTSRTNEEANDEERENQDSKKRIGRILEAEAESPAHARPPALSESTPDSLNQTRSISKTRLDDGKPWKNRRREKKHASVQTTLSLSMNEAHYTECKECGMLYNHLHETDVKYHARRHAALRRAKAQASVKSDAAE